MKYAIVLFGLVITMVRKASATCDSVPAGFTVQGTSNAKCAVSIKLFRVLRFFPSPKKCGILEVVSEQWEYTHDRHAVRNCL